MKLESQRLWLYPIGDEEMQRLSEAQTDPEMRKAYAEMLQGCLKDPGNRFWYAVWYMELKEQPGVIIGDYCFKGIADDGAVEIGYGLREGFCGHGYMTEAVRTASAWALSRPGVTRVEAETDPANTASQRVLMHAGFSPTGTFGEEGPRFACSVACTGTACRNE